MTARSAPVRGCRPAAADHDGAKSGQPRVSPLAYFRIDGKLLIIGSFAGADVNPAWVHNLRANPSAHVEFGTDSSDVPP